MARSPRTVARRKRTPPRQARQGHEPLRFADFPWGKIALIALVLAGLGALISRGVDLKTLHARVEEFNGGVAFALLAILPLLGFPVRVLHIAAGIRFGAVLGVALVSLSILLQLLASYAVVRLWGKYFENARWVKKVRARIPDGAHASVCVFAVLIPGAPFAAVNYVLPMVGVPLRTFLLCAWPLHTLRSTVTVILGDQSDHLTATRLALLIGYALLILGASWWTYRRMQSQLGNPPQAAGGRKQPA